MPREMEHEGWRFPDTFFQPLAILSPQRIE
jgi:hypothetical protein